MKYIESGQIVIIRAFQPFIIPGNLCTMLSEVKFYLDAREMIFIISHKT